MPSDDLQRTLPTGGRGGSGRKRLLWSVVAGFVVVVAAAFFVMRPIPIEGAWWGAALKCLCDSKNFMWFEDGRISKFSDSHLSERDIGEYRPLGDGGYAIKFYAIESEDPDWSRPAIEWETTPRRTGLEHPLMDDLGGPGPPVKWYRYLFRVWPWVDTGEIMRSAAKRDRQI